MTPIPLTPKPSGSILHLGSYLRPSPAAARERRSDFSAGGLSSCKRNILNECFFTPPLPGTINHNNMDSSTSSNAQQQQAASFATPASAKLQQHQQHQLQMQMQQQPQQQQPLEPFQQYSLLRGQANGGDADLVGVLRQVSEMTMNNTPRKLPTPQSGNNNNNNLPICETPDQKLLHVGFTPDPHYRYHHRQFSGGSKLVFPPNNNGNGHNAACDSKRKPSPMYHGRKKVRSMATTATADSRVFNAPPLPSSPELSVGGRTSRHSAALPPQFSPIASLRMDANATQAEATAADNDRPSDLAMALPDLPPPDLPPPPPPTPAATTATETTEPLAPRTVNGSSTSNEAPPPAMPWMDTPEQQTGRKRLVSLNQLKMRKRNLNNSNSSSHSLSHSLPFNG